MVASAVAGAADLTTGEAVLDNYVTVTGGTAAYAKVHNMIFKGSLTMAAMGLKGSMTIYSAEPNKASMTSELAGVGKVTEGTDGANAWSFSAMQGPQLKKGDELADSLREALFHKETEWRTVYKSAEMSGTEEVAGKPAYKVILTPKSGAPETHYFEKESGLMIREQTVRKSAFGEIPVDVSIGDYRKECGGVMLPHLMIQTFAGQKLEMKIDTVECNATLPSDAFDPPAEVKALLNKEPAAK